MIKQEIRIDGTEIRKVELRLGQLHKKAPTVMARALNRAAQTARSTSVNEIRKEYVIKAKDIRSTMRIKKASRSKLGALLVSCGNLIPLDQFKFKPKQPRPKNPPKSLKVSIKKTGYKDLFHAFVADIGGLKIYQRTTTKRLPIRRLTGPAVPQMLGQNNIRQRVLQSAYETYEKRLDHEINRTLEVGK